LKKLQVKIISIFIYSILLFSLDAKLNFLGKITKVEPKFNLIIMSGEPFENIKIGQIFEVILGDEVYGKVKVSFVGEEFFEGNLIQGSVYEIFEIISGRSEQIHLGQFYIIEPDIPQKAVVIYKRGKIKKINIIEQLKEGFRAKDSTGNEIFIAYGDMKSVILSEEDEYYKYVKKQELIVDILPGQKDRDKKKVEAARKRASFKKSLRLAKVYNRKKNYKKALVESDKAIRLFSKKYHGYYWKGRVLTEMKSYGYAAKFYRTSLIFAKQSKATNKDMAEIEFQLARLYLIVNNIRVAKYYLEKSVDHGNNSLKTTRLLVDIELKTGRFNEALSTAKWALKKNKPGSAKDKAYLYKNIAKIYLEKQDNLNKSLTYIQIAASFDKNDLEIKKILNKILLEKSKKETIEKVEISRLTGGWKTSDNKLYFSFFEESVFLLFYRKNPISNKLDVILIEGIYSINEKDSIVTIEDPKTQKFRVSAIKSLKYSSIKKLRTSFSSGEEEVTELDKEIVFKIKEFTPLKLVLLLDGKTKKLVPMDMEE